MVAIPVTQATFLLIASYETGGVPVMSAGTLSVNPSRSHEKDMPKSTLNAKNLEPLGAERLAELLLELSRGNAAAKQRLRMELAGERGTDALAKEVRNRITTIERSRSFVDWQGVRTLANDLDTQGCTILEKVAKADPKEALGLLWRLMDLASVSSDATTATEP